MKSLEPFWAVVTILEKQNIVIINVTCNTLHITQEAFMYIISLDPQNQGL